MKNKLFLSFFSVILISFALHAQTSSEKTETLPEYKAGNQALYQFIDKNIQYPQNALDKRIRGTVLVNITIGPKGTIVDSMKVVHSVDPDLDKEALRIASLLKNSWKPGTLNRKAVTAEYSLAISFIPPYNKDKDGRAVYGSDEYNFNKGMASSKNKDYLNALFYFSDALDSNSSDVNILFYRCLCKVRLGDKTGACDDYKRITSLKHPDKPELLSKYCKN
jgi:TonB family protein